MEIEKAIAKGRGPKNQNGLLASHREFRRAWKKAGRPKYFIWDTESGGKTIGSELAMLYRRRRELKDRIARRRLRAASGS